MYGGTKFTAMAERISEHARQHRDPSLSYSSYRYLKTPTYEYSQRLRTRLFEAIGREDVVAQWSPSTHEGIAHARDDIHEHIMALVDFSDNDKAKHKLALLLEELLVNAATKHGNEGHPQKIVRMAHGIDAVNNEALLYVADEGPGFDPHMLLDPTVPENILRPNGRGIKLIDELCIPALDALGYYLKFDPESDFSREFLLRIPLQN